MNAGRLIPCCVIAVLLAIASGCQPVATDAPQAAPTLSTVDIADLQIVSGQTVFVPAYPEIFYDDSTRTIALTTTLAIHNTDPDHEIVIRSVRYYDTDGALVREFIESPVSLNPLATTGFVVPADDSVGGWGANFLIEWGAESPVYEPVIEAIMINTSGALGLSFVSEGRVVSEQAP